MTLGRVFDIRVGVHASWLVVYVLLTVALANELGAEPRPAALAFGTLTALALFASVVAHEFAHALVARRYGVKTSGITLFLFGGVATLENEPPTPRADAAIAIAGPALSGLLACAFFGAAFAIGHAFPGLGHGDAVRLASYVAIANGVLAVFNAIPAYPMDGGRVLRGLLWHRFRDPLAATTIAARVGMGFALAFIAAAVLTAAATQDAFYLWYLLLGTFLLHQGWSSERTTRRMRARDVEVGAAA